MTEWIERAMGMASDPEAVKTIAVYAGAAVGALLAAAKALSWAWRGTRWVFSSRPLPEAVATIIATIETVEPATVEKDGTLVVGGLRARTWETNSHYHLSLNIVGEEQAGLFTHAEQWTIRRALEKRVKAWKEAERQAGRALAAAACCAAAKACEPDCPCGCGEGKACHCGKRKVAPAGYPVECKESAGKPPACCGNGKR